MNCAHETTFHTGVGRVYLHLCFYINVVIPNVGTTNCPCPLNVADPNSESSVIGPEGKPDGEYGGRLDHDGTSGVMSGAIHHPLI